MRKLTISAVGDVFVDRPKWNTAFAQVQHLLQKTDFLFGNCEGVYSRNWERAPSSGVPLIAGPIGVNALAHANFTVMSMANNHAVDGGFNALLTTCDELRAAKIAVSGAGEDYDAAHKPAIVERNGRKIATLSYTSVFPHGYEARGKTPGLAVLRAHTNYVPWEINEWNPGLLPRVTTVMNDRDHQVMRQDIVNAKKVADIVLVSVHWGDFTRPYVLTDHERRAARIAIDAGADVVFGHHHHLIRGIEYYRNKPIFYGLGHFVFDLPNFHERLMASGYLVGNDPLEEIALSRRFGDYRLYQREGYPLLPFHPDARLTLIASVTFESNEPDKVTVIPCIIDKENSPYPLAPNSSEAQLVLSYLKKNCELEALDTEIVNSQNHCDGYAQFDIFQKETRKAKVMTQQLCQG